MVVLALEIKAGELDDDPAITVVPEVSVTPAADVEIKWAIALVIGVPLAVLDGSALMLLEFAVGIVASMVLLAAPSVGTVESIEPMVEAIIGP